VSERALEIERAAGVGWIWLSRPEVHNAFDAALIGELTAAFAGLEGEAEVRAIVLAARGKSFSAGAQVQWMRAQGAASVDENAADARRLAMLFQRISTCAKPTVARVQGAALGGGVGLVAACDIALGSTAAVFGTTEVRLGVIPATIGPYVMRAIGERQARRFFLSGERFDARTAERIGLLHEAVEPELLDERVRMVTEALLAGAPVAQREAKELMQAIAGRPITEELIEDTAQRIARRRAHAEAGEGVTAFLEKRAAKWVPAR
jgi:methylglutaconyl-CoA hydratase